MLEQNSIATTITNGENFAKTNTLTVIENNGYVAGDEQNNTEKDVAKYWKNGIAQTIETKSGENSYTTGLFITTK